MSATATTTLLDGIWTPWAEVVCRPCHGPTFYQRTIDTAEHERLCLPLAETPQGDGVTTCDRCQKRVAVSEKVAMEHEVMLALRRELGDRVRSVGMSQTGGMCSAVSIVLHNGREVLVTEAEGEGESYLAGYYDPEVDGDEGLSLTEDGEPGTDWSNLSREGVVKAIKALVEKARA